MINTRSVLFVLGLTATVAAQNTVQISIGIRETDAGGGTAFSTIGGNGGCSGGGIEWVNLDGQTLTLDGTWQQFTFNLTTDTLTQFAGTTANGVLDGTFGTLEHIRVLNNNGITDPITVWVDEVANTITDINGRMMTTVFGDFEGFAPGDEVLFQEPGFSGSTAGFIDINTDNTGVDLLANPNVMNSDQSGRWEWQFLNGTPTNWMRLTSCNASNVPNPQIRFDQSSVITFWMRGRTGWCQDAEGGQGPGAALADLCGTGLNAGQSSTYLVANAPAPVGYLAFSFPNQMDIPIAGGTVISGTGFIAGIVVLENNPGMGDFFTLPGTSLVGDLIMQCGFPDMSLPQGVAFTNAVRARFGQ